MPEKISSLEIHNKKELAKRRRAKNQVVSALPKALDRMIALISAGDPKVAFYAAKFLIEQGLGKAKQQIELEGDAGMLAVGQMFQALIAANARLENPEDKLTGGHSENGVYIIDPEDSMHYDEDDQLALDTGNDDD